MNTRRPVKPTKPSGVKKPLPASTPERRRNRRSVLIGIILFLSMGFLMYELWAIQTVRGDEYRRSGETWRINRFDHLTEITPARGWIMDRNMQPIATSQPVFHVALDLVMLAYRENRTIASAERSGAAERRMHMDDTLNALHEELDIPLHELQALFIWDNETRWRPVVQDHWRILAREVPASVALPLRDRFTDIYLEEISLRTYHDPFFAPQVLGFIRGAAQWGLEGMYHEALSGVPGRRFRAFDADNTPIREELPVQHGKTIVTTLDPDIQRLAQATVDHTFRTVPSGAVAMIVMDPHTGEILAMAQAPNFSLSEPANPAFFGNPQIYANWDDMTEEEQVNAWFYVWRNYHITRSFEPGSVFKPVVVAAALEEGVISPNEMFYCRGFMHVMDREIECFRRIAHGSISLSEVIAHSCNVAMIEIMHRLGQHQFYRYRGYFGFGERTGIDLPGEEAVSSPLVMYGLHQLGPVQLATSSIGQGFNTTTMQAATAFSALINGGYIMRPYVVSHVIDAQGAVVQETRPQIVRSVISPEVSNWMRVEMQEVITAGTGRQTQIPGHAIGGKTGTAQQGAAREIISLGYWIYTPIENPEFLIFAVIENVENRDLTAGMVLAPILRGFLEDLIFMRNMPPSMGEYIYDWNAPLVGQEVMPDFAGYRIADVARNLVNLGINFQVQGGGSIVTGHFPAAGRSMPQPHSIPVQIQTDPTTAIPGGMTFMPYVIGMNAAQAHEFVRDAALMPVLFGGEGERVNYEVYQQFPMAGTEIEQQMSVILRVRRRDI